MLDRPPGIAPRTSASGTSNRNRAWVLDRDNFLKGHQPRRGDVVLVPLTGLPLTEAGRAEAAKRLQLVGAREAHVALDARGHASSSCRAWRDADPEAPLDPVYLSPKLLAACGPAPAASASSAPPKR